MIVKTEKGYVVFSTDGKRRLSEPLPTLTDAKQHIDREAQKQEVPEGGGYGGRA